MQVRLHLLTAVMKCFFKRPPETQKALGAALAVGLADFHQVEVTRVFFSPKKLIFCNIWSFCVIIFALEYRMSMIEHYSTTDFCNTMFL